MYIYNLLEWYFTQKVWRRFSTSDVLNLDCEGATISVKSTQGPIIFARVVLLFALQIFIVVRQFEAIPNEHLFQSFRHVNAKFCIKIEYLLTLDWIWDLGYAN